MQVGVLGGAVEHDAGRRPGRRAGDSGRRGRRRAGHVGEGAADHDRRHAGAGERPAVLALDEGVGLVVGVEPPAHRATVASISASSAGMPRPIIADRLARRADRDRVHVDRGDDRGERHGRVGGEIFGAEQATSSAVVARNRMSRAGRGPAARAGRRSRSSSRCRSHCRPRRCRSGRPSPSGRQMPRWSQWARSSRLSPVAAAAAQPADRHCWWCSGWTAVVDLDRGAERQRDGAEGGAGLVVEQPARDRRRRRRSGAGPRPSASRRRSRGTRRRRAGSCPARSCAATLAQGSSAPTIAITAAAPASVDRRDPLGERREAGHVAARRAGSARPRR